MIDKKERFPLLKDKKEAPGWDILMKKYHSDQKYQCFLIFLERVVRNSYEISTCSLEFQIMLSFYGFLTDLA